MPLSYKPLFKLLVDHDLKTGELCNLAGLSRNIIPKLKRGKHVSTESLAKICTVLKCDVCDIVEFIPENSKS